MLTEKQSRPPLIWEPSRESVTCQALDHLMESHCPPLIWKPLFFGYTYGDMAGFEAGAENSGTFSPAKKRSWYVVYKPELERWIVINYTTAPHEASTYAMTKEEGMELADGFHYAQWALDMEKAAADLPPEIDAPQDESIASKAFDHLLEDNAPAKKPHCPRIIWTPHFAGAYGFWVGEAADGSCSYHVSKMGHTWDPTSKYYTVWKSGDYNHEYYASDVEDGKNVAEVQFVQEWYRAHPELESKAAKILGRLMVESKHLTWSVMKSISEVPELGESLIESKCPPLKWEDMGVFYVGHIPMAPVLGGGSWLIQRLGGIYAGHWGLRRYSEYDWVFYATSVEEAKEMAEVLHMEQWEKEHGIA